MVGYAMTVAVPKKPVWLEALLAEKFFAACSKQPDHIALKKNEKNIFCVDCSLGICQHCLSSHNAHHLLQVRRYVYHDVIRLHDIQKLIDCALVQTYIINSARVVFLNQRPQLRPPKGLGNTCETCERSLQEAYRYCSVACKVDAFVKQGKDVQAFLCDVPTQNSDSTVVNGSNHPVEESMMMKMEEDEEVETEEQLSPMSVLLGGGGSPEHSSSPTSSSSTSANDLLRATRPCGTSAKFESNCTAIPQSFGYHARKKKRGHHCCFPIPSTAKFRRRKGTPHRSPIY